MSVVAAYLYQNGQRADEIAVDAPPTLSGDKSEFVWIGLFEPTEAELGAIRTHFNLHPLAVEDAFKAHQLPKVEVYGDQLFIVAHTAHLLGDEARIAYGETAIFVGERHIITVRHGSARAHTDLRRQLEASPSELRHGVDYVLHGILDFIVDGYLPIVDDIEEEVLAMEQRALESHLDKTDVSRLFSLRRELMRFQRILAPMMEVGSKLAHRELPCIDAEARPYFRDVLDHVQRMDSRVGGLREALTSVFEASSLLEQQRQSDITRKLAAWAAILAVPTAIAGIYGMNFQHMPELATRYGYFVVLAVIFVLCGYLHHRFKRAGWL